MIMKNLDEYLKEAMKMQWQWGLMDCCMFGGDWIAARTGQDPMRRYRGIYKTAMGARRLIAKRGGLAEMTGVEMALLGFERTETPEHGDIAVMAMPAPRNAPMAVAGAAIVIRFNHWWVARKTDGIAVFEAPFLAAWRIAAQ